MALTSFTDKSISTGDQTLAEIAHTENDFVTMQLKFTAIDQDVKVKIEQSADGTRWADVAFPGSKDLAINIKGTGNMALNAIGLHAAMIRVKILKQTATTGVINNIDVLN